MSKHINTGAKSHSNTGTYSHNDVAEVPHADVYSNSSAQNYYKEANAYNEISSYSEYHESYDNYTDYDCYSDYSCYSCYSCGSDYSLKPPTKEDILKENRETRAPNPPGATHYQATGGHSNTSYYDYNCHTDTYNQQAQYGQVAGSYTESAVIPHKNSVTSHHNNTGYTDHINTNTNTQPSNISGFKPNSAVYYKTTVNLTWNKATDDKCISVISASYGDKNAGKVGIFEYNTKKVTLGRGVSIGCWNANGTWNSGITKDTYTNANLLNDIKNHINSLANGCYIAIGTWDAVLQAENLSEFKTFLTGYGFKSHSVLEGSRSCFAGIFKKGTGALSEQSYRYGTTPTSSGSVSAQYTIAGLGTQTITYTVQYAFKPAGGSYGAWTNAGTTTSLSLSYSLASHGSGYIKFRVIANDGMENSPQYVESQELRVLKYNAPNWVHNTNKDNIITAAAMNEVTVEINKLSTALELGNSNLRFNAGDIVKQTQIRELREKINSIANVIKKSAVNDSNVGILYSADINNIKKFINEI